MPSVVEANGHLETRCFLPFVSTSFENFFVCPQALSINGITPSYNT